MKAIATEGLTKSYGKVLAVDTLDLSVEVGEVFGFLGPNGAGKTTTIRLLLDVIRPSEGRVQVLGLDPQADGVAVRRRSGYLPGDFVVDGRQTGRAFLTYLSNLRDVDTRTTIADLALRLDVDLDKKIGDLSKGNRQKIGLIQAFMHTPELLILDEPTSGLDPLMAREFLAMVDESRQLGQTIFMSSHILSEVQQVADRAAIIREGRLIAIDDVEALRQRAMRHVRVSFAEEIESEAFQGLAGVEDLAIDGQEVRCRLVGEPDALIKAVARYRVSDFVSEEPDLEELFFHYYAGDHSAE